MLVALRRGHPAKMPCPRDEIAQREAAPLV
jgi:hypothetical protein